MFCLPVEQSRQASEFIKVTNCDEQPTTINISDVLQTDHTSLDKLMQTTMTAIEAADVVGTLESLDLFWARLAMHIRSEHLWLFPAARAIAERRTGELAEIPQVLTTLREDHDFFMLELARAMKAIRSVSSSDNEDEILPIIRDLLKGVAARLETRNNFEEEVIYPLAAAKYLERDELDDLFASIRRELDNYPARFARAAKPR